MDVYMGRAAIWNMKMDEYGYGCLLQGCQPNGMLMSALWMLIDLLVIMLVVTNMPG